MFELLRFSLLNAGISYIITQSFLFNRIRDWTKKRIEKEKTYLNELLFVLMKCPLCMGFWTSLFSLTFLGVNIFSIGFYEVFTNCCIGSITSMMIYSIIKK